MGTLNIVLKEQELREVNENIERLERRREERRQASLARRRRKQAEKAAFEEKMRELELQAAAVDRAQEEQRARDDRLDEILGEHLAEIEQYQRIVSEKDARAREEDDVEKMQRMRDLLEALSDLKRTSPEPIPEEE